MLCVEVVRVEVVNLWVLVDVLTQTGATVSRRTSSVHRIIFGVTPGGIVKDVGLGVGGVIHNESSGLGYLPVTWEQPSLVQISL